MDAGPEQLQATYRVVSEVERPGGKVSTLTSFVVDHGSPGAQVDETCEAAMP